MNSRFLVTAPAIVLSFLATVPLPARAQDSIVVDTFVVTDYANGGIGQGSEDRMHRIAHDFPLRIEFSERKDGEFIADVPVVISDAQGNPVFTTARGGPMLDVVLPNGKYKVSARFKGRTESQDVTLDGKDGKDLYFHWKEKSQQ